MSFIQEIETDLINVWQRLVDDEHPAANDVKDVINKVKAEAATAANQIDTTLDAPATQTGEGTGAGAVPETDGTEQAGEGAEQQTDDQHQG